MQKVLFLGYYSGLKYPPIFHFLPFLFLQKRRRPTLGVQLDDQRKEMLKKHPLSVHLVVKCKGKELFAL